MNYYTILFYIFALLTIASAVFLVTTKNIMYSAVALFVTLFNIACLYILLRADFIAVTQIMVYVGGILILLLFGIMLTHKITDVDIKTNNLNIIPSVIFTVGITAIIIIIMLTTKWRITVPVKNESTINEIGKLMLTSYLLPFEIASIVLLIALIGSAMYARKINKK
ncbi:MAG: NADH-quinone oxidoreductase subunit J [Ignavibacteriae bacterium]|nr:NADH-quinone oxidoreductase subunit J [Ignavibacteriota bacterium]